MSRSAKSPQVLRANSSEQRQSIADVRQYWQSVEKEGENPSGSVNLLGHFSSFLLFPYYFNTFYCYSFANTIF